MSVVSESESNTTLVDAVSSWNIQSEGLGIRAADTPIPSERISNETLDLLSAASEKLTNDTTLGQQTSKKRKFRQRMYEHQLSVNKPKDSRTTPVSKHFTGKNHSAKDLNFSILEWCTPKYKAPSIVHRRRREQWWMWNIGAIHPIGINQFI